MVYGKFPYPLVIVISLAIGCAIGAMQGVLVAYAKIPSFIVTLGGMLIFRGLTGNLLLGQFVGPFARGFQNIASGFIPDFRGLGGVEASLPEWAHVNLLSLLIGVGGALVMFGLSMRGWARARAENMEAEPLPLLIAKNLVFAAIIIGIAYSLALYKGLPVVLLIIAAPDPVLRVRDDAHGDRPAHLRARRQPAGRAAFPA